MDKVNLQLQGTQIARLITRENRKRRSPNRGLGNYEQ
jgi:hypothetical protein